MWSSIYQLVRCIFYPDVCVHCGALGSLLCPSCYESIEWSLLPPKIEFGRWANSFQVACMYSGPVKSLVRKFKFWSVIDLASVGAELIHQSLNLPKVDALVPVPVHSKRLSQRGYNQAELLASALSKIIKIPMANMLQRTEHHLSQVEKTTRLLRTQALTTQFVVKPSSKASSIPKSVLLIDDVVTTGTTLLACARALKRAGVKQVSIVTLAHGY